MELVLNTGNKIIVNKAEIVGALGNGTMMIKCVDTKKCYVVTTDSFYNREGTN